MSKKIETNSEKTNIEQLYRCYQQQRHGISEVNKQHIHEAAYTALERLQNDSSRSSQSSLDQSRESRIQAITDQVSKEWDFIHNRLSNLSNTSSNSNLRLSRWYSLVKRFFASLNITPQQTFVGLAITSVLIFMLQTSIQPNGHIYWEGKALENCESCNELAQLSSLQLRGTKPNISSPNLSSNTSTSLTKRAITLGRLAASLELLAQLPNDSVQVNTLIRIKQRAMKIADIDHYKALRLSLLSSNDAESISAVNVVTEIKKSNAILSSFFDQSSEKKAYLLGKELETFYLSSISHHQDNNPAAIQKATDKIPLLLNLSKQLSGSASTEKVSQLLIETQAMTSVSQQQSAEISQRLNTLITALSL